MDPQATWTQMLDALATHDWDAADQHSRALLAWIDSGGFPPVTVGPETLGHEWHRDVAAHVGLLALARARNARRATSRAVPPPPQS